MGIIYKITNNINGKIYIGFTTKTLKDRFYGHIKQSKKINPRYYISKSIKKYGINNFHIESIDDFNDIDIGKQKEKLYIKKYNSFVPNGYNCTLGGDGSLGHILSDESRQKIKNARKNQIFSKETRELWSKNRRGKELNHGYKISKTKLEKRIVVSNETKEKIRKSLIGRKMPELVKNKIYNSTIGKINKKYINENEKLMIYNLYINNKFGLHRICQILKENGIKLGHCVVKKYLISTGVYNVNSSKRKNQYL